MAGLAVVGLVAVIGGLWLASAGLVDDPVGAAVERRSQPGPVELPPVARSAAGPVEAGPVAEPRVSEAVWERRVTAVRDSCGLAVQTGCVDGRCVSLTTVPPLDHPMGWVAMARRSPRLVAAVVAGDLGLPDRVLPCREAIRGLGPTETLARAHGGGEAWCLAQNGEADRGLCDQLSKELLGAAVGFEEGVDRRVELRPPG